MDNNVDIEKKVQTTLATLGVVYKWIEVDPEFADTLDFCKKYVNFPQ